MSTKYGHKNMSVKNVSAKCGNHLMDPFNFPLNEKVVQGWLWLQRSFSNNDDDDKTATRTSQNNRFNEQKQSLCTCVLCFCTFLCRHQQNNNVKSPNARFFGEREHTTVKFSFSFPT